MTVKPIGDQKISGPVGPGGGGSFSVSPGVAAIGLAGAWPAIDLFALSPALSIGAAVFFAFTMLLYAVANGLTFKRPGLIKLALFAGALAAALIDPLVFHQHVVRFVVVDAFVLVCFIAALLGLWKALLGFLQAMAAVIVVALLIAPFTPEVTEDDTWQVTLEVVDEQCAPLAQTPALCEAAGTERLGDPVELANDGGVTDDSGARDFEFAGNPLLKGAVCQAFKPGGDGVAAYPMRSTTAAAPLIDRARARIQLQRDGETAQTCGGDSP